jgi:hypothetical protein
MRSVGARTGSHLAVCEAALAKGQEHNRTERDQGAGG